MSLSDPSQRGYPLHGCLYMILNWRLIVRPKDFKAILPAQQGLNTKLFPMYLLIGMKGRKMLLACTGAVLFCVNQGFSSLQLLLITLNWTDSLELVSVFVFLHMSEGINRS